MAEKMHYLEVVYVEKNGDDATGDGSKEKPFATIQKGLDAAANNGTVFLEHTVSLNSIETYNKNIHIEPWVK
ncbi:hypothetical protein COU00_00580 [Candidatus Falkowbacteria bacterium CG10_big_fil_rev_8_21_14_0_10_43_11]|uniref:Uncharacterized protein n=1 Tax=Candidatus Falkowbacteria bacterium CG10_big_fil_rev_8_21_14_0_10_43_11 TaxID=1974568 RepID=A0A2M6WMZ4_9BACT|nr:MAG: hypothetical protein COU00_00580 [Candidatus Falkowbacteria bacterium CG10_big_fil_rev_8_21_14_0_10_43_11]